MSMDKDGLFLHQTRSRTMTQDIKSIMGWDSHQMMEDLTSFFLCSNFQDKRKWECLGQLNLVLNDKCTVIDVIQSELWSFGKSEDCEFVILWVSLHELLDYQAGHHGKTLLSAFAMVYWLFLPSVEFIKVAIFFDECDKVSLNFCLDFSLTFIDRLLMFLAKIFVGFETLSNFFRFFAKSLFPKFGEICIFFYQILIVV